MERSSLVSFFLFALVAIGVSSAPSAQQSQTPGTPGSAASLASEATFIFVGTVRRPGGSTMSEVPASRSTAVVRVDEVVEGQGAPGDLKGAEITLRLAEPDSLKEGERATFFTRGWLMGDSLAVVELGHTAEPSDAGQVRTLVANVHQQKADDALRSDIASAEVIVVGTVLEVKPAGIRHIGSEHDPDWYQADIKTEVLKGSAPGPTVTVLFPHSDDLMWRGAPKFTKGEQGIWLLHRNQERLPGIQDRLTALQPLDFQATENRARIESLLKATR